MGTSLTPEFWDRFVVLLVVAAAMTVVLAALLDTLAVRIARRRGHRPSAPPPTARLPHRPAGTDHRTVASR
ncbi:hypothetical protein K4B79_29295 [Streptomyces lincolnensis]|uniref:hypothetical protein n=1 Tax=Streptomyces lincolnensis TaxID=1915 RepID=UPI001E4D1F33|nr:hypothetical protein [Streptomyces lincolnensis]MCD7442304.1 hypothetical protein [Streptomyces lincolnensis]